MRRSGFWAVLAITALLPAHALAHAGGEHLMGVVESIEPPSLVIATQDGRKVIVHLDEQTRYERSGAAASAAELKPGERVVVHTRKKGETQHALLVRWGKQPARSPAPQPQNPPGSDEHGGHAH